MMKNADNAEWKDFEFINGRTGNEKIYGLCR